MKGPSYFLGVQNQKWTMLALFFFQFPAGVIIGLLTPDNILQYEVPKAYAEFVATFSPFVRAVGLHTRVPATQFIAAMLIPITSSYWMLFLYVCLRYNLNGSVTAYIAGSTKDRIAYFLAPPFFSFASWVAFRHPDGSRFQFAIKSKMSMATFGVGEASLLPFGLCFTICSIILLFQVINRHFLAKDRTPQLRS